MINSGDGQSLGVSRKKMNLIGHSNILPWRQVDLSLSAKRVACENSINPDLPPPHPWGVLERRVQFTLRFRGERTSLLIEHD